MSKDIQITDHSHLVFLPDWCYAVLPSTGALIVVERDVQGYGKLENNEPNPQTNRELATAYNARMGVSQQQEAAMLGGSLFGWDTPAARVSSYDAQGQPIPPVNRMNEAESSFLTAPTDAYALYQLKSGEENHELRFESLSRIHKMGKAVDRAHYELVYTAPMKDVPGTTLGERLNAIFQRFNLDRPSDFTGHSLSVSDVIAVKQNGQLSCHYVDSYSFPQIPDFLPPENALKNAEMAMEDDYGMIDGIINNGKSPAAKDKEKPPVPTNEKPSVRAQLKPKPMQQERNKPPKAAERGMER